MTDNDADLAVTVTAPEGLFGYKKGQQPYAQYAVGTSKNPFPMSDRKLVIDEVSNTDAPDDNVAALRPIERSIVQMSDDKHPLVVTSQRPYEDVIAMMLSELPNPSMMHAYREAWKARAPGSDIRMQAIMGDTAAGKSYMAESIANIRDPRGAIIVHCHPGTDLNELLWETVLDLNGDKKLAFDKINDRLQSGKLHTASSAVLASKMGDAFVGHQLRWELLGYKDGEKTQEQLHADLEALNSVAHLEQMVGASEMLFTLKKTHGPIIRAAIEGREVLIDEYEKTQRGSEVALYGLMHLLKGGKHGGTFTAHGGPGQEFVFKKDELPEGFFITITGNLTQDGHASRLLADSEAGRIQPVIIPKTTLEDMQHRMCQIMTGVPISTHYYMRPNQWDANPKAFARYLKKMHPSTRKGEAIPDYQEAMIDNWQNTLRASALLTQYHSAIKLATDTTWLMRHPELSEISREVTAELRKNLGAGDLNYIERDIREARRFTPRNVAPNHGDDIDVDAYFSTPVPPPATQEPVEEHYGNRLVARTLERIEHTVDAAHRPHLAAYVNMIARLTGMQSLKDDDEIAAHPDHQLIANLLNNSSDKEIVSEDAARIIQKLVADTLRKKHAGLSAVDEDIVPIALVATQMNALESKTLAPGTSAIVVPNTADTARETLVDPLTTVMVQDSIRMDGNQINIKPENLLDIDTFLAALAMPDERQILLSNLWTEAMAHSEDIAPTEAVEIAEATHNSGLAMTTVCCKTTRAGIDSVTPLHILLSINDGNIIVIGEGDASKQLLKQNGITYINRNDADAVKDTENALNELLKNTLVDTRDAFRDAFVIRNTLAEGAAATGLAGANNHEFAQILTDPALSKPTLPVQISRIKYSDAMTQDKFDGYREMIEANRAKQASKAVGA